MAVFTAAEALNLAMRAEQNGQIFYENAAKKAEDAEVKALMEELAAWEVRHHQTFKKLAEQVGEEAPSLPGAAWEEYDLYMQAALDSALFSGPDKALALVDQVESGQDALRMALGFEKDTLLFYYDLRELVPEAHRATVDAIIREEKTHVLKLGTLLRSGTGRIIE
jgi:rubrerythrin